MANDPNILSGEDVGMILLGKEIQIMNLQRQIVGLQQQVEGLSQALEEKSNAKQVVVGPDDPIPFPRKKA